MITFKQFLSDDKSYYSDIGDEDDFTPEELKKIKAAPFPGMAANNIRHKKKEDEKRARFKATNTDNESSTAGPSGNDY